VVEGPGILLSVFEPFGGASINASQEAGIALAALRTDIELLTLPVVRGEAEARWIERMRLGRPTRFAVALGEADAKALVRLEKIARNIDDFRIPDNAGNRPDPSSILAGGPEELFSTVPVEAVAERLADTTAIEVAVSRSAGTFVCNHLAYCALHYLSESPICPFVFVHVPKWRPDSDLALDDIVATVDAVLTMIIVAAGAPSGVV
jgi:pyroglutamyl-peptidase